MQQNRNSKNTSRMASAVSMAKAQPARGNVAQPSRTAGGNGSSARTFNGQVDPQWQQKLSGGSRFPPSSVFRPSSVATNNNGQRSDSNFTSSSIGNANRRRPGQQNGGFDAKLFLRQQQKGQYLHAASAGVSPAPAPTTNTANGAKKTQSTTAQPWQQPAARQFTPSMDPKAFDIEQFKAMQPRRALLAPNSAMQQQQQQQQSTTMQQQQQSTTMQQQQQQQQQQQTLQQRSRQQQVQSTALSVERQTNATDNDDDDNDTAADEPAAALPWQTAKQNLDARPAKATTSKEILQQMAAMRSNATPALGTTQASNVSVLPDGAVSNTDFEQQN